MPLSKPSPIHFYFRNQVHRVEGCAPTRTVLQHVREDLHCTGTKEACAEGDCGACTVVFAEAVDGQIRTRAVNACIQLLPALDGKALFTVEDLKQADGSLHPVQQALVDHHASQCGFCTPGFVMALWAWYVARDPALGVPDRLEIDTVLSGNLCRCTGYQPIIAAAMALFSGQASAPQVTPDQPRLPTVQQLAALQHDRGWLYSGDGQQCFVPHTRAELGQWRRDHPDAHLLAGGTDIGLWVTKLLRPLPKLIYLGQMPSLATITHSESMLEIGAMVNLNDAYRAMSAIWPRELAQFWQRFASHPIRNSGTLGGNLANGSPIGDSMPFLIALGAQLVLQSAQAERIVALEDFYLAYQKKDLHADEWVASVRIPLNPALQWRTYKLSKRFDQDISAVCAAFAITLSDGRIAHSRIAFGGMAATPKRASSCEAFMLGEVWDETTMDRAATALEQDFQPLSDMRASSQYRMRSAQQLLKRFWLETRPDQPLATNQVQVFASGGAA